MTIFFFTNMKKVFFYSLLLSTVVSGFASANTLEFSDIGGRESRPAIEWLQNQNIVQGYSDGTFQPNKEISRAEFLKIILQTQKNNTTECTSAEIKNIQSTFSDVSESDWFAKPVCNAYKSGIIQGYTDGKFRPHQTISRAEGAKIVSLAQDLTIPTASGDWYNGFFSAITQEKAVSDDFIASPAKSLTREEMAEVTWRLETGNTKAKSDELQKFGSCEEMTQEIVRSSKRGKCWECGRDNAESPFGISPMLSESVQFKTASNDYSTTNVQEANVEESDTIKNDGSHIFIAKNNSVKIITAYPVEDMTEASTIMVGDTIQVQNLFLQKDILVVLGQDSSYNSNRKSTAVESRMMMPAYYNSTEVRIYDVSDRKNPKLIRSASLDGQIQESRVTSGVLYLVASQGLYNIAYQGREGKNTSDLIPSVNGEKMDCSTVSYIPNFTNPLLTSVFAIDITNPNEKITMQSILGNYSALYMSEKNMYLISADQKQVLKDEAGKASWKWQEVSHIFKFGLNKTSISLDAKGMVEGSVLNQYSMSEYNENFRIATQVGQAWGQTLSDNRVTILDKNLVKSGEITGIAKGENIKSARFVGNKGYLVTFKTVDPLFVLDMNPLSPKIEGELKIPGWSDYLHPIDETHILGIGKEVDESIDADKVHDENAVYYTAVQGVKLAMFDVTDVKNPKEIYKTVIGERGTETEASYNPRALLIDTTRKIIGFPITVHQSKQANKCVLNADNTCSKGCVAGCEPCTNPSGVCPALCKIQCVPENQYENGPYPVFQGAMLYGYTDAGFEKKGEVSHFPSESTDFWNEDYRVSRLIRISENFYSISEGIVKALDGKLQVKKEVSFIPPAACKDITSEWECTQNPKCQPVYQSPSCAKDTICLQVMVFESCTIKN